ncbi:bifunctional DNA-formamidopyrimidine glycosylase/DNA-(apurinic or apyrimidinic site) lyase [Aquabacterium fontiphilum]|uniref:bifunctional DNA-formamidopyrimidine glycosylase/DNA-(apurinic or apyrimidinic site) lyase n=1 Tax=Aquabacterium fontiphilum TaxID=450365 RepID=UPI0013766D56|nr:bifunctional DNA-formamidopyrimidine glycosylase/DNA-(apurinic or apyrimidinic site) lyase [Aquabacterium fontiphilum]NBD20926.1 bifunctional DNA-formamidopyrimidine glycosylase/DNA-(apurinic or apyrimidinic site) lyase [Aquabacterium fontiphilum]
MPELPEVEVTRRALAPRLEGALVEGARVGKPLRWPLGCEASSLAGLRIDAVSRRGKYLWLALSRGGAPAGGLLWHLGMSGSLAVAVTDSPPGPHHHFDLLTSAGCLRLTDPRRFGAVVWGAALDDGMPARLLARLGREPFDPSLTAESLWQAFRGRRVAIKPALMAGDVVVGAGNIYACEALYRAGIDPRMPAGRLSRPRSARLLAALQEVLAQAIDAGGSSLKDFRADGHLGGFQNLTAVYGRAGLPCLRCGHPVTRTVQAQRATFFCPGCQKR